MKPRLSKAAIQLREQFDDTYPDRDRRSDGWIGDTRHASRPSDHNPDPKTGVVRAIDIDRDVHKGGSLTSCPILLIKFDSQPRQETSASPMSYSTAELHQLAWAGAGENTREAIRTTIIAISLSLAKVMRMVRSLISRY